MQNTLTAFKNKKNKLFHDTIFTLKSWKVWIHMGSQDIRGQFRRSRLGVAWVLINLSLMVGGVGYVYGQLFHQDLTTFLPQLLIGIVLWAFISATVVQACGIFINAEGYIKQFSFPKQIYILRFLVSAFFNLIIGLLVYFIVALILDIHFSWGTCWFLWGICLLLLISTAHLTVFSYWGSKIRDLSPALSGIFSILFYITPVIFTPNMLKERGMAFIYLYNPLYYLIEVIRYPLLHAQAAPSEVYMPLIGYGIFIWVLAMFTALKCDQKVAYWL